MHNHLIRLTILIVLCVILLFTRGLRGYGQGADPHPEDAGKNTEHLAMLDLVQYADATHVAATDGAWSDPTTWNGGTVPGTDAIVVIPTGRTVLYDLQSDSALHSLRVDGILNFSNAVHTRMVIDTIVVTPNGRWVMGTAAQPIPQAVTAEVIFAANGPIDTNWDPQQLSRGFVSHGTVRIHGAAKTVHLKLAQDATAGTTELVLAESPTNWQVGDRLVLTGSRYVPDQWNGTEMVWQGTEDEELTITALNGNRITVELPLQFTHATPRSTLKASVANFTRNIRFSTTNGAVLPANQRGHVMFMHADSVDVRYAAFVDLGRTDKSILADDFLIDDQSRRLLDDDDNPQPGPRTNIRGRYAVHFHRTGVNDLNGPPAVAIGNAVWGSPGWGYVHHDSHVRLENNAAYNVFGAAFVAETGNEIGEWRNNIAIKSEGMRSISKELRRTNNHDIAHNGVGFWFQGRLVANQDNVAAGQRHAGITYLMRGVDQLDVLPQTMEQPHAARYNATVGANIPPIQGFRNNEVFASGMGFEVIKANPRQGHDVRSVIDRLTAWEVPRGFEVTYTSKYTFLDTLLIGATAENHIGADFGQNSDNMVMNRATIDGFDIGVSLNKSHTSGTLDDWHFVLIDLNFHNVNQEWENYDPTTDQILTGDALVPGRLAIAHNAADFVFSPNQSDRIVRFDGIKTDSIGPIAYPNGFDHASIEFNGLANLLGQGYYVDAVGTRFLVVEDTIADRASTDMLTQTYVVTLSDEWNEWTLGRMLGDAPQLGTYGGQVAPGLADTALLTWLGINVPTPTPTSTATAIPATATPLPSGTPAATLTPTTESTPTATTTPTATPTSPSSGDPTDPPDAATVWLPLIYSANSPSNR